MVRFIIGNCSRDCSHVQRNEKVWREAYNWKLFQRLFTCQVYCAFICQTYRVPYAVPLHRCAYLSDVLCVSLSDVLCAMLLSCLTIKGQLFKGTTYLWSGTLPAARMRRCISWGGSSCPKVAPAHIQSRFTELTTHARTAWMLRQKCSVSWGGAPAQRLHLRTSKAVL